MNKLRTIGCCFCMLICSIFLFAGCSSATQYSIYYKDGSRSTEYQIKVDSTACTNLGLNPTQIMQKIQTYAAEQESFMRTHGLDLTGVKIQHGYDPSSTYTYNFAVSFATFEAYCNFYGITQEDLDNTKPEIVYGLFVSRYIVQDTSLLDSSGKLSTQALGIYIPYATIYEDFRINICGGNATLCDQLLDKIQLNIIKCFPLSNGYRSNANETGTIMLPEGVGTNSTTAYSAHFWSGTFANPPAQILVYRNYVLSNNRIAWYVTAIILTVLFGAILTIVLCIKNKKKNATENASNTDESNTVVETTASALSQDLPQKATKKEPETDKPEQ